MDRVPLVLTFSNLLPNVHGIVRKHLPVLYTSERMNKVFSEPPLVAYRRDANLADALVHSKTSKSVNKDDSNCGATSCRSCDIVMHSELRDTGGRTAFTPQRNVNCTTKNVVYVISCSKCSIVTYVGETERQLKERMSEHLRDIRLRHEKPISSHFDESHTENDLRFSVLEVIRRDSKIERQLRESIWIKKLKTEKPYGCNNKEVAVHPTVYNLR